MTQRGGLADEDPPLRPSTLGNAAPIETSNADEVPNEDEAPTEDEAGDDDWALEEVRIRFAYFDQRGRSIHSQADFEVGLDGVPRGDIDLEVYQAMLLMRIRQTQKVRHAVTVPVDIVTSASADALDAVSAASRVNEAVTVDVTTEWSPTEDDHIHFRYGAHIEEPFRSGFGGMAYIRDLAQDNFTFELRAHFTFDVFDPISPQGFDRGSTQRKTLLASTGISQVLSPTTIARLSYGLTYQWGTLQNTWNSVPIVGGGLRVGELLPPSRLRHAVSGRLSQHVPATQSTLHLAYRYYRDDFDLDAHTADVSVYQWLGPQVYFGLDYRFHYQSGVPFFVELAPAGSAENDEPRTSDEDLGRFNAHQLGGKFVFYINRQNERGDESLSLSYHRYFRPNLDIDVASIGYARRF